MSEAERIQLEAELAAAEARAGVLRRHLAKAPSNAPAPRRAKPVRRRYSPEVAPSDTDRAEARRILARAGRLP